MKKNSININILSNNAFCFKIYFKYICVNIIPLILIFV